MRLEIKRYGVGLLVNVDEERVGDRDEGVKR